MRTITPKPSAVATTPFAFAPSDAKGPSPKAPNPNTEPALSVPLQVEVPVIGTIVRPAAVPKELTIAEAEAVITLAPAPVAVEVTVEEAVPAPVARPTAVAVDVTELEAVPVPVEIS